MNRTNVTSSNIVSVGYNEDNETLEIEFKGGSVYQYSDVPKSKYQSLMSASSIGGYFHSNIKDTYPVSKI